jgi:DNA-binding PadR family transcriptional regulator
MSARFRIPQGTLDMLILQILSLEPAHGYRVAQRLQQISRDAVQVTQGSLYPALHRLEQRGWRGGAGRDPVAKSRAEVEAVPAGHGRRQ